MLIYSYISRYTSVIFPIVFVFKVASESAATSSLLSLDLVELCDHHLQTFVLTVNIIPLSSKLYEEYESSNSLLA